MLRSKPNRTRAGARTEGADRIEARREPGPGLLSRLPGMAYQCRNDPAWTMEFVSEGCRTLTGYDPAEVVGPEAVSYADIIHPDDRERVWDEVQRALASDASTFEFQYRIVTAGGEVRDVWEQGHPVYAADRELLGLEGFITDVTELEHTGRRLASSQAMVRSLVEQGLAGVYVIQDGLFRSVNPAFAGIFGYTVDEIQDRLGPLDLTAQEDLERVEAALRRRLEQGESAVRYEFTGVRKDGSHVRIEVHGTVIELGGQKAIAGVLIDLTERRALEDQLRHAQRVEGLGELTGAIAHDFNNYLTAIIAPIELVLQDLPDGDPSRDELLLARETARRAASLTRQLLSFARKRVYSPRPLNLNEVLGNVREMLDRLTGAGIEVTYELAADLPPVEADPSHLQQILVNLVVNARDAMDGRGTIAIGTRTEVVEPWQAERWTDPRPGAYVALSIRDDGKGMDRETLERIFDPYFTTKEAGTGLGLSTVHGIVKQHEGELRVTSAPGEGTEFTVLLPRTERVPVREEATHSSFQRASVADRGAATILVVEDEEAVRRVTVAALRRFGYTVLAAGDGSAALDAECSCDAPIDLLLTDLMLPDTTGPELVERIRARRPGLPAILMSGYAPEEVLRDLGRGSGFRFLEKPFVIDGLLEVVGRGLGGPAAWREGLAG